MTSPEELRAQAELAYTSTAFDYVRGPIGSRDWHIFWQAYQAASDTKLAQQVEVSNLKAEVDRVAKLCRLWIKFAVETAGQRAAAPHDELKIPIPPSWADFHGPRYLEKVDGKWALRNDGWTLRELTDPEARFVDATVAAWQLDVSNRANREVNF